MENGQHDDACPVCLSEMDRTKANYLPCGHCVCDDCDKRLLERRFLFCPTCRTPRLGVSDEQVQAANVQRSTEDQNEHNDQNDHSASVVLFTHQNQNYQVIFFPSQGPSSPLPFTVLENHAPTRRVTRRMAQQRAGPYRTMLRRSRVSPGTPQDTQDTQDQEEEAEGVEGAEGAEGTEGIEEAEGTERVGHAPVILDAAMSALIDALRSPTSIQNFLARRRGV